MNLHHSSAMNGEAHTTENVAIMRRKCFMRIVHFDIINTSTIPRLYFESYTSTNFQNQNSILSQE